MDVCLTQFVVAYFVRKVMCAATKRSNNNTSYNSIHRLRVLWFSLKLTLSSANRHSIATDYTTCMTWTRVTPNAYGRRRESHTPSGQTHQTHIPIRRPCSMLLLIQYVYFFFYLRILLFPLRFKHLLFSVTPPPVWVCFCAEAAVHNKHYHYDSFPNSKWCWLRTNAKAKRTRIKLYDI